MCLSSARAAPGGQPLGSPSPTDPPPFQEGKPRAGYRLGALRGGQFTCSPCCSSARRLCPSHRSPGGAARTCPRTSRSPASCLWRGGTVGRADTVNLGPHCGVLTTGQVPRPTKGRAFKATVQHSLCYGRILVKATLGSLVDTGACWLCRHVPCALCR